MSTVYFTSDPHFGHQFMADLRGFSTVEEHDEALVENYRSRITKRDVVYWLGDLTMNNPRVALDQITRIPAQAHHLILGNHDRAHPKHKDAKRWQRMYFDVFESVMTTGQVRIYGQQFLLSHHPYQGEGGRDIQERDTQWRLRDLRVPLIHGHTHASWNWERSWHMTPQIHVGLDAWGLAPVHVDQVWDLYENDTNRTRRPA